MQKFEVNLSQETLYEIVLQALVELRDNLELDYNTRRSGEGDLKEDLRKIEKLIKSFDRVIKYCCVQEKDEDISW